MRKAACRTPGGPLRFLPTPLPFRMRSRIPVSDPPSAEGPAPAAPLPPIRLRLRVRELPADTITPVSAYLRLRDRYPGAVLLEGNDPHAGESRHSFLALDPMASLRVEQGLLEVRTPAGRYAESAGWKRPLAEQLAAFTGLLRVEGPEAWRRFSGFFGHAGFDAVQHFETIALDPAKRRDAEVPDLHYRFYRFVLVFDHFRDRLAVLEHGPSAEGPEPGAEREPDSPAMADLLTELERSVYPSFPFRAEGEEEALFSEAGFLEAVERARGHCRRGDVFQMVLSRRFRRAYRGDEFAVYRALRSVNPSPYLFFFDFGDYRLFGSSPEAQLVVRGRRAEIHPIAGTYRRSGSDAEDAEAAKRLADDPKENAEHVMLVDLARNDLGRHGRDVRVAAFRDLQFFSHVIHLVSRVEATLEEGVHPLQVFGDTFPAGTLSGAPKYRALELIDRYEPHGRGFYGGAVGFLGLDGDINHAIVIRSVLARDGHLHYQAGAGVVVDSDPASELREVDHKLGAVRRAIDNAQS